MYYDLTKGKITRSLILFMDPVLSFLQVPEEVWDGMRKYLFIVKSIFSKNHKVFYILTMRRLPSNSVYDLFINKNVIKK